MKTFSYKSKNQQGRSVTGTIDAETEVDAVDELRRRGLTVPAVSARRAGTAGKVTKSLFTPRKKKNSREIKGGRRIRSVDLAVMSRQMSTMVAAGIPILEVLEVLAEQNENPKLGLVLQEVAADVRNGKDLSHAVGRHPKVFNNVFVNMVNAGEASGQLDIVLSRLADYMEEVETLKGEVKSAMTYPVMSLFLVGLISLFLLVFIIPQFKEMFDQLRMELPALTSLLLGVSTSLRESIGMWFMGFMALVTVLWIVLQTEKGKRTRDAMILKLPIFGPLFIKVAISRFARTFSTLISSGVPILGSLEIVQNTTGNRLYAEAISTASNAVRSGETLGEPLAKTGMFPPMVTRMIGIGEKSGALEQLLGKIADFYDQQVRSTLKSLTSLIEPILISVIGVIVGGMVISVFVPLVQMVGKLNK